MNIKINKKDDIILKILHYFITEEDYKPVIINGIQNEIWLENMEKDLKLIRINNNYIHNDEQLKNDMNKAKSIMKTIKKNTFSFNMNMLNLLLDTGENVKGFSDKNIETVKVSKINDFKKKVEKTFTKEMAERGCIGSISEMYDSKTPYLPKGAVAQAWSVAETFRIIFK